MKELGVLRTLSNGSMLSPRAGSDANGHREAHRLVCLPSLPALPAHIGSCRLCASDPFVGRFDDRRAPSGGSGAQEKAAARGPQKAARRGEEAGVHAAFAVSDPPAAL